MSKEKMLYALDIAGKVCTDAAVGEIELLLQMAKDAADTTYNDIRTEDVAGIDRKDTLVRLQRNAMALRFLLDQARDVALAMRTEIASILSAEINNNDAVRARHKAALERELKRKYNEKQRKTEETL